MGHQIVHGNKLSLINFYREQLQKYIKLGVGNRTKYDILITNTLIERTRKRLEELSSLYESELTEAAFRQRKYKLEENLPL